MLIKLSGEKTWSMAGYFIPEQFNARSTATSLSSSCRQVNTAYKLFLKNLRTGYFLGAFTMLKYTVTSDILKKDKSCANWQAFSMTDNNIFFPLFSELNIYHPSLFFTTRNVFNTDAPNSMQDVWHIRDWDWDCSCALVIKGSVYAVGLLF